MSKGTNLLVAAAMFTAAVALAAPTVPPTFVYKLQTSKRTRDATYLARTPDNAALVLVPQREGRWSLIRLTGLGMSSLHEEKLALSGLTMDQLQEGDASVHANLDVSPDGHYAVVRTQTWKTGPPSVGFDGARAQLTVIDLQTFKVVSTLDTSDPMYAGSFWVFNGAGMLMTESNPNSTAKPGEFQKAYSIKHKAVALVLPDLKPSVTCSYTEVFGPASFSGAASHRDVSVTDLSGPCSELVKLADASSVRYIYHDDPRLRSVSNQLHFGKRKVPGEDWDHCEITGLSIGEKFALYVCTGGHLTWYDTFKTTSFSASVLTILDSREVISVPLPPKQPTGAILVTIAGQDYLLILIDGIDLAMYRLQTMK
jgi:hypothetical protein